MQEDSHHYCRSGGRSHGYGPDSSRLHDPKQVCDQLNLKEGDVFADIGCGAGRYALAAAGIVGKWGRVYALDRREDCIDSLAREAAEDDFTQLQAVTADITAGLPIDTESCNSCFICTVLHSLNLEQCAGDLFRETYRILKPEGRLFVIECKKINTPFGPPRAARISPEELDELVCQRGFLGTNLMDLGYNYMREYIRA